MIDIDRNLHVELVKLQRYIIDNDKKVIVIFEGRDAAGKGGMIKTIMQHLNPRHARVVALDVPTEKEKSQWYFQRYIKHFPSKGELVLFDRSWYNRAGVERVLNFCTRKQYRDFLIDVPKFERLLESSGIKIIKYWLSVTKKEQQRRFKARMENTLKRWKLSSTDIKSMNLWDTYSRAKDNMLQLTGLNSISKYDCPKWHIIDSNNKQQGRIDCIKNLLSQFKYEETKYEEIKYEETK